MDLTKPVKSIFKAFEWFGIDWKLFLFSTLIVAVMLWLAGSTGTIALKFEGRMASLISGVCGSMLLVSLFVERMVEVLISVWYEDNENAAHKQKIDYLQASQGRLNQDIQALITERNGNSAPDDTRKKRIDELIGKKRDEIENASNDVSAEEKALLPYEASTRKVSTWIGLVIGIFTSAAGFRFLSQIVVFDPDFMKTNQYQWFVVADVLLTGAVLSGGSKLVHQIFSVYESFTESTKKSLSDKSR